MAMGKKQDIGDIIRDAMSAMTKPKRSVRVKLQRKIPKPPNERTERRPSKVGMPRPMPRKAGDKPFDREKAILPRRPRNPRKPISPSTRQMPKRKPKNVRPRKSAGNY